MSQRITFTLPTGYLDPYGNLHRQGWMRVALATDEVEPQGDPRTLRNEAYLAILVLSRVIEQIGTVTNVTPELIGALNASDFLYLQDVYLHLNAVEPSIFQTACPFCTSTFEIQIPRLAPV